MPARRKLNPPVNETHPTLALRITLISAVCLAALAGCGGDADTGEGAASGDPLTVMTASGEVHGAVVGAMRSFQGIPYAAPPVGPLRWRAPNPPAMFTGVRDATKLAPHCPQIMSPFGSASTTEDCLYLNVYAPMTAGPHPVMFWIHGGAFTYGESDEYDASPLVAQGVVVVTINYRLGTLGFLSHPALTAEGGGTSGNYGLLDQQFALQWVQHNIDGFGGDEGNVTIFGESAGGFSVHSQLVLTGASGLFQKAISQSGAYANADGRQMPLAMAETLGKSILTAAGCADPCTLDAARAIDPMTLVTASLSVPGLESGWIPSIDGKLMTMGVGAAFKAGVYAKVPMIEGSNHDEYRLFVGLNEVTGGAGPLTPDNYTAALKMAFGEQGGGGLALAYPPSAYMNNAGLAMAAAGTDAVFACPALRASDALVANAKVFSYEFNDPKAPQIFLPPVPDIEYGAAHASELQYLFVLPKSVLAPDQKALSDVMVKYWTNFAKTGDPNAADVPMWPAYMKGAGNFQNLAPGAGAIAPAPGFSAFHKCDLIDPVM